jgi:hypothetical protein
MDRFPQKVKCRYLVRQRFGSKPGKHNKIIRAHFWRQAAKNRAFRLYLLPPAASKGYRFNPLRGWRPSAAATANFLPRSRKSRRRKEEKWCQALFFKIKIYP